MPRKRACRQHAWFVEANRLTGAAANELAGNRESERGLKSRPRLDTIYAEPLLIDCLVRAMS